MKTTNAGKSMREQLAPLSAALREDPTHIQPVCQVTLRLEPGPGGDRFHETIRDILRWLNNRAGQRLPEEAWGMNSFEMTDVGSQRTAAVGLMDPLYWAARLDDADKQVPRRTWVTEIGVGLDSNLDVLFGVRLICVVRGENPPFRPTVPGFVRTVLAAGSCKLDGQIADGRPRLVDTPADVEWLVALLEQEQRTGDVIVLAHQQEDGLAQATIADANSLAQRLRGVAHIIVLTSAGSYGLTDRVGRDLSVFRQAVRTYRPGFRAWDDDPGRHPLALPGRIKEWQNGGVAGFEDAVCARAITNTAYVPGREDRLPSFTTVRQFAARLERESARLGGASETEMLRLYEEENQRLSADIQEQRDLSDQLLREAELEREVAIERANDAIAQAIHARERVRQLEERLIKATGKSADTPIPDSLSSIEEWCEAHLPGSVVMSNRAFQGIKKSEYQDPSLIYRALLLLRDQYVPMRIYGGAERKSAYLQVLSDLQMEESLTGDGAKFEGSEYTVQYQGIRRELDRHLKRGNSREPRFCFRLYFFWDDESQVVVVGWLPSHLENRMS